MGGPLVGQIRAEVETLMQDAIFLHLAGLREFGLPVPGPHNVAGVVAA